MLRLLLRRGFVCWSTKVQEAILWGVGNSSWGGFEVFGWVLPNPCAGHLRHMGRQLVDLRSTLGDNWMRIEG